MDKKIQLKDNNGNNLFPNASLVGIDTSNLLASGGAIPTPYTASQDCFVIIVTKGYTTNEYTFYIDDNKIARNGMGDSGNTTYILALKKGQKLTWQNTASGWNTGLIEYLVYGAKR